MFTVCRFQPADNSMFFLAPKKCNKNLKQATNASHKVVLFVYGSSVSHSGFMWTKSTYDFQGSTTIGSNNNDNNEIKIKITSADDQIR